MEQGTVWTTETERKKKLSGMDITIHGANTSLTYNINDMSKQIITFFLASLSTKVAYFYFGGISLYLICIFFTVAFT